MTPVRSSAITVRNWVTLQISKAKKLVLILATSLLVTEASKEEHVYLERVPYIHYPLCFQKDTTGIIFMIDLSSEVNAMTPAYASKLGLKVHHTNVGA